jgi:hypothetical protein
MQYMPKSMLYMSCRGKCRRGSGRDLLGDIGGKCQNMSARPQKNTKTIIFFNFFNFFKLVKQQQHQINTFLHQYENTTNK